MSAVFRGILCRLLEQAFADGDLTLPDRTTDFQSIKTQCYQKKWVIFCEKPFSNNESLVHYLGNYTHRVAISNHRIIEHQNGKVAFWYKDYKSAGVNRSITLDAEDFIRRFLQHILPAGFCKIRYFGFLALCNIKSRLSLCFDLIEKTTFLPALEGLISMEVWRILTGRDPLCCPKCKSGKMRLHMSLSVSVLTSG